VRTFHLNSGSNIDMVIIPSVHLKCLTLQICLTYYALSHHNYSLFHNGSPKIPAGGVGKLLNELNLTSVQIQRLQKRKAASGRRTKKRLNGVRSEKGEWYIEGFPAGVSSILLSARLSIMPYIQKLDFCLEHLFETVRS
jgi:hypothetical protein